MEDDCRIDLVIRDTPRPGDTGAKILQVTVELRTATTEKLLDCVWNVMAHAQKPDFVFQRNGRVHLNQRGLQFSRLLAAEVYASAVVMLDTPCSEVVWRVLDTHSIRQFPLHFPARASPCALTFQLDCTTVTTLAKRAARGVKPLLCESKNLQRLKRQAELL